MEPKNEAVEDFPFVKWMTFRLKPPLPRYNRSLLADETGKRLEDAWMETRLKKTGDFTNLLLFLEAVTRHRGKKEKLYTREGCWEIIFVAIDCC